MKSPPDSSDAELNAFDAVCQRLAGFDDRVCTEWADAYLTALAAGPYRVPIDEWLPRLTGGSFERTFADPEDEAWARSVLESRAKVIASQLDPESLLDSPDELRLQPVVTLWDDELRRELADQAGAEAAELADMRTGALWAEGFRDALKDFQLHWPLDATAEDEALAVFEELLEHVLVLGEPDDSETLKDHVARHYPDGLPTREDLLDEACFAIQDLRVWWLDHAPKPPSRHVEAQPGRNDPCPCGSGLKFKKCHGRV